MVRQQQQAQWLCLDSNVVRPPWKYKGLHLPPLRAITSDCGHKVSLQTFLKDEALPCNPFTGFAAYPDSTAMTTACSSVCCETEFQNMDGN